MSWLFEITTGNYYDPLRRLVTVGYSGGNQGKNPEGINNPEMEGEKNIGPLPEGLYHMGEPVNHTHLGPFAIPLTPDPKNDMKGRGGFYIHGDTKEYHHASEGCVILGRPFREKSWGSSDHELEVVAKIV
jgi:hypothetical protein